MFTKEPETTWVTAHTVEYEDDAIKVLSFGGKGAATLIVPPQAGHHSFIADYGKNGNSLVQVSLDAGHSTFAIEWKPCTFERRNEGVRDLLEQLENAVECAGGAVNLVGLCQGGWLSTIYTVMHPGKVSSLTVAGSPIDAHAGEGVLDSAIKIPLYQFKWMVALSGGVLDGRLMILNWKLMNPFTHYYDRYIHAKKGTARFYQWYDYPQDVAGKWYLECVENLFQKNQLINNEMVIDGQRIDLSTIKCPVYLVAGGRDDISPKEQTFALAKFVNAKKYLIKKAHHLGVFMGSDGIKNDWPEIMSQF